MSKLPVVAIVGRANVGKSSMFNRMVAQRQAIIADEPGTTRDAVYGRVETAEGQFILVDTAGLKTPANELEANIQDQLEEAAAGADCIVVAVEYGTMITEEDRRVAKMALKSRQPVILAVNKVDIGRETELSSFKKLGIKEMVTTSASQNRGFSDLTQAILQHVEPSSDRTDDKLLRLALVGRPNVGKSSLFNRLTNKEQALVADKGGTTRDVNRAELQFKDQQIEILDTAGIRKSGRIARGIEQFSVLRAISAIEEADVCVLVIDATEPGVALDQKLAGLIKDAGKGLILALTKWDLVEKDDFTYDRLVARLRLEFQYVAWAPFMVTSAESGQNTEKLLETALNIHAERIRELKTRELNVWLGARVNHHPPAGLKNKHPKLRYMTQTGTSPPEFTVFGAHVRYLHWSYKRYLEREMRESFGFEGTPIRLKFLEKEQSKL